VSDLRLIKANIALFNGATVEARRLLDDYVRDQPHARRDPQVLWLDAQMQPTRAERLSKLRDLLEDVPREHEYARLAAQMLAEEAQYAPPPRSAGLLGLSYWQVGVFVGVLVLVIAVMFLLPSLNIGANTDNSPTDTPLPTAAPTLPDRSLRLPDNGYIAAYTQGILQVTAYEAPSERVVLVENGVLVQPVLGARFIVLEAVFECRAGICSEPPQAEIALRLDNGVALPARADLAVAGERIFQPIAQDRTTMGWLVFEVPSSAAVVALEVLPGDAPAAPLVIALRIP
jgi:hypothetical protein